MPGKLSACVPGEPYRTTFWSLDRDPKITDKKAHAARLIKIFRKSYPGSKIMVAPEVSGSGYAHDHVLIRTHKVARFSLRFVDKVRRELRYVKPGGIKQSIRAFHTGKGSQDDYHSLSKYLTESRWKVKPISNDIITLDDVSPRMYKLINDNDGARGFFGWQSMCSMGWSQEQLFEACAEHSRKFPHSAIGKEFLVMYGDFTGEEAPLSLIPGENKI